MKRRMKAALAFLMTLVLLTGCSGGASSANSESTASEAPQSSSTAQAEATGWKPEKDVTFIVGFDAGGTADIPARVVAKYMSDYSGVNVTVANIVGASGQVAARQVMEAEPDGYTLLHVPVGYYLQAALGNADFTYEDFTPVTMWCDSWVGLAISGDSPYNTYEEFIAAAKENPGEIRIGTVAGTLPQLALLALEKKEGVEFNKVDLGSNNKATELLGGRIDGYIDTIASYSQYVDSGDFKCLMAFAYDDTELPGYEGLPTAESLGYTDFDYLMQSFGMWMPADAPEEIVDYWAGIIEQCANDPKCQEELNALGYGARADTPEEYTEICKNTLEGTKVAVADIVG